MMLALSSIEQALLPLAVSLALSGCTTFGTNVSGSFRCEAPDGICAPSTVIDDRALVQIARGDRDGFVSPTSLYKVDDGIGAQRGAGNGVRASDPLAVTNEGFRLSVVFPSYTDTSGIRHERSVVSVNAQLPGRGGGSAELAKRPQERGGAGGILAAAQAAPLLQDVAKAAPVSLGESATSDVRGPLDRIKADTAAISRRRAVRQADPFNAQE